MPHHRLGRSWGTRFDSLTSSDSISSNPESAVASSHPMSSPPCSVSADEGNIVQDSHDRILPDASIFIGSLPTNIEYADLTNMLSQHLSEHPQVKSIKVVRDSKGGTCAFIQCQDAEEASVLMNNLHVAAPQPFFGRYLRYEPARAFRTLLVSYRSPRQYMRPRDGSRKTEDARFIELQLPNAMRIFRTHGTKHLAILYDSAALDDPPTDDADGGLLLVPLLYDAESLMRIASVFGVVDYFGPYAHENENGQVSASLPAPHDGPRSPIMDPGCWKVKWAHRDDCVSALMTLRRIPHVTITWAHQSNTAPREQGFYHPHALPAIKASKSWRSRGTGPGFRSASCFLPAGHTFPTLRNTRDFLGVDHVSDVKVVNSNSAVWQQETSTVSNDKNHLSSNAPTSRPRALSLTHDRPQSAVSLPSRESTGQLSFMNWESTNRSRWADHTEPTEFRGGPSAAGPDITSSPYLGHLVASSDSGFHTSHEGDSQEIEIDACISHSPDFETSSITHRTPGSLMLRTPTTASYMGDFQSMSFKDYDSQGPIPQFLHEKRDEHAVDPTTIFVGGLEMFGPNAWDESKVKALFSKYGGIEAVKVIRPSNKRSAFAFVKFNNTEAPARAVKAEHNRMLDGRLIRVQLRDWNPAYRLWRPGPNKELNSQLPGVNDSFGADTKLPKPRAIISNISANVADLKLSDAPTQPTPPPPGEACDLNEVQDETGISPPEVLSADDPVCHPRKGVRRLLDIKQSEPTPHDATLALSHASAVPGLAVQGTFSAPTIQYYPGWIPNYVPQFPYQMPFVGQPHPGNPFPSLVPLPQCGGLDSGTTLSNTPIPVGTASCAYPPFAPYPPLLGHGVDSGQATAGHLGLANNVPLIHPQAPLVPTGFIQGDQGMLVPVYPPDALDQYMAGNPDQVTNSGPTEAPVTWRPYPPPPICPQTVIFHSYINPPLAAPPPHYLGAHAWHGVASQSGNPHGTPGRQISSSPAGAPTSIPMAPSFERGPVVPPRRQYRRDNHCQHHKSNFARGTGARFGKAPPLDAPSRAPSDIQPTSGPQIAIPNTSVDANWQSWNMGQGNPG